MDVTEQDDLVVVTADLPGFERDDLDLTVSEDVLTIRAEREETTDVEEASYVRRERSTRSVKRAVTLPVTVDEDAATATYTNGVLTVHLPIRSTDDGTHRIDVE